MSAAHDILDSPTESNARQRRSRELKAAGYRVLKGGLPIDDESLSSLVQARLIDFGTTESDLDTLDAISELIDQLAELDRDSLEAIRVLMLRRDR
ncbi:MAG: hypothetical protein WD795_00680 [Woeseia sp.]